MNLLSIIKNKVLLYLGTRYITYFVLFLNFVLLSTKLGPYNYGVWGFITMILGYYRIIDFGIPNSLNVLMVQNNEDKEKQKQYILASLCAILILVFAVVFLSILYSFKTLSLFEKYHLGNYFYAISIIAILEYVNKLFSQVYRVRGKLFYISLYQSITPILVFLVIIIFSSNNNLIPLLLSIYVLGGIIPLTLFLLGGEIQCSKKLLKERLKTIIKKGLYLFFYNSSFYLILTVVSTIISIKYPVEQYGFYTFSYMLGHCVLMFLDAFAFLIYPKTISKLYNQDKKQIEAVLHTLRVNYTDTSHLIFYVAYAIFPIVLLFFPDYKTALLSVNITSLSIILSTNTVGYTTYLIANNKEKTAAGISVVSLLISFVVAAICAYVFKVEYSYVPIAIMVSYLFFAYACGYKTYEDILNEGRIKHLFKNVLTLKQFIPYCVAFFISIFEQSYFSILPLILFVALNVKSLKQILHTVKTVLQRPEIINV